MIENEITLNFYIKKIEKLIVALEKNKMKGYSAKSKEEIISLVDELTKNDKLITSGGSMSMIEAGVVDFLNTQRKGIYLARESAKTHEESEDIMRKAYVSDTYLASTNAITEQGELYNVDGLANRVSAMAFGPKQVILIVGINKLVPDMESAIKRVETIAAPVNCVRLNKKTPCANTTSCMHCRSDDRICCTYVRMGQQRQPDRIKVILAPFHLGY